MRTVDAPRRSLEAVWGQQGQQITFKGGDRRPSGPIVEGTAEGRCRRLRRRRPWTPPPGWTLGRAEAKRVERGGEIVAVDERPPTAAILTSDHAMTRLAERVDRRAVDLRGLHEACARPAVRRSIGALSRDSHSRRVDARGRLEVRVWLARVVYVSDNACTVARSRASRRSPPD